jgi:hypothetical protein
MTAVALQCKLKNHHPEWSNVRKFMPASPLLSQGTAAADDAFPHMVEYMCKGHYMRIHAPQRLAGVTSLIPLESPASQ